MRTITRLALASGGALLLSFAIVPMAQARNGADDPATGSSSATTSSTTSTAPETHTSTSVDSSHSSTASADDSPSTSASDSSPEVKKHIKERSEKIKAEATAKAEDIKHQAELRKTDAEVAAKDKLDDVKLKVCQRHATTIDGLMTRIGDRGQKQLDLISTIVSRVEAYKTDNKLTVANYDVLTAEVAAQKIAAETAITAAKAVKTDFKCDGSDPKGVASIFKNGMKAQNDAVKTYRNAAKNLLAAVKQAAQGQASTKSPSATPGTTTSTGQSTRSN